MRICQISSNYPPRICGIADYTKALSEHLAQQGAEVSVVTSALQQPRDTPDVTVLPIMRAWDAGAIRTMRRQLAALDPDVVHLQYQIATFNQGSLAYLLPLLSMLSRRYALVTTFHDYAGPAWLGKLGPLPVLWLLAASSRIVVTHDKPRNTFAKIPFLRKKLAHIPIGSNIPRDQGGAHPRPPVLQRDEPILCFFGFVWRGKNIEQLIQAQRALLDRRLPTQLLIIGEIADQPYHQELLHQAQQLDVADRIYFTGSCDPATVSQWLQASDICVLPFSNGATTGHGTLIAALDHQLPIVTTIAGDAPPRHFIDSHNMMLTGLDDLEGLIRAVSHVIQSRELRDRLRWNAGALAREFSWSRIAQVHLALYAQMTHGRPMVPASTDYS